MTIEITREKTQSCEQKAVGFIIETYGFSWPERARAPAFCLLNHRNARNLIIERPMPNGFNGFNGLNFSGSANQPHYDSISFFISVFQLTF